MIRRPRYTKPKPVTLQFSIPQQDAINVDLSEKKLLAALVGLSELIDHSHYPNGKISSKIMHLLMHATVDEMLLFEKIYASFLEDFGTAIFKGTWSIDNHISSFWTFMEVLFKKINASFALMDHQEVII